MDNRKYFIFAVLTPLVIDFIVTSIGQPVGYWSGFGLTNEGNPLIEPILRYRYFAFLADFILYGTTVFFLIKKLLWRWALWSGFFVRVPYLGFFNLGRDNTL